MRTKSSRLNFEGDKLTSKQIQYYVRTMPRECFFYIRHKLNIKQYSKCLAERLSYRWRCNGIEDGITEEHLRAYIRKQNTHFDKSLIYVLAAKYIDNNNGTWIIA